MSDLFRILLTSKDIERARKEIFLEECFRFYSNPDLVVPVLISCPHVGLKIPEEERPFYDSAVLQSLEDTDWYVNELYESTLRLGVSRIEAVYSRCVVDLNRPREPGKLYRDGRKETGLFPTTTFGGRELYTQPVPKEVFDRRIRQIYEPYHKKIAQALAELKSKFGFALLIEAHSIKRVVPAIQADSFPDIMLGCNQGNSAPSWLVETMEDRLIGEGFQVTIDDPFQGGYITRFFGKPAERQFAVQIEMSQDIYLSEDSSRDANKAKKMKLVIEQLFKDILEKLNKELQR